MTESPVERIRYSDDDVDVRLGDHVTYKSMFFWRGWKPGRVSYLPGQSPVRAAMERDGAKWIGVTGEGGTYRGFLIDPTTLRVQGAIKFDRRPTATEPGL
jgi:hypothetical protein